MVLCSVAVIAQNVAGKCVDQIVEHIGTEVGHLWNYNANLEKLQEEIVHLHNAKESMKARIADARNRSGESQVDPGAATWLEHMDRLTKEAFRIIQEEERETGRCLMGLRPNLLACYRASKSAEEVMESADKLKKDGESITKVAHVDYSKALGFATNPDYEELESRKKSSEQIVAYLKDPSVRMVGMYGMGGTGKTTLAEKMGVQLFEDGTFRYVVKTNVSNSKETNIFHIQKQIADLLKIKFEDDKGDVMARANHLREQLQKKDKVLIILDDVWANFDLRDVGCPLDRDIKILITSRDVNVMNEMNSRHNVPLDVLSPEDSWKLFDKMASDQDFKPTARSSDRYSIAQEVVEQCGGIPILLVTIARTLRNKDLEIWKEALLQLKEFGGDKFVADGYKRLEVSYNFLPNNEIKSLFLLCAQLDHHSIRVDDLLRYTMGLDLLKHKKLCRVKSKLYVHLNDLKGYCLLQDGIMEEGEETVRMHDVVHRFATSIARDHLIGVQLQEWPPKYELEQFSAISLLYYSLPPPDYQLPVAFESSKLKSFLFLRSDNFDSSTFKSSFFRDERTYNNLPEVPDKFFTRMKELKVIDLRCMSLSLSSFHVLEKLRTLCLEYCELDDVAVIGELPMLQVLSLKGSTISQIRSLGNSLKLLDLSNCAPQIAIASGVLSNLILLEDLRIGESFNKWESLPDCNSGIDHETLASLREFKNLANLINLDINIPDTKTFSNNLLFEKLERYRITIGCQRYQLPENSKSLGVRLGEDSSQYEKIKVLIEKAKYLHLEELLDFTSVCEMVPKGFPELINLTVKDARGILCIIEKNYNNCVVFPKLVGIELRDMSKLERICDDHLVLPVGSFQNLTTISIYRCDALQHLFSSHLALKGLSCLKEIEVGDCKSLESIVSRESENRLTEIVEFPKLQKLLLNNLGRFISFSPITSPSQERQEQDPTSSNQPLLTSLFNKKVVLPNLTILTVAKCDYLSYLLTSSMVKSLAQLKKLTVRNCGSFEEIVATSKGEEMAGGDEDDVKFSFPALQYLGLSGLPKLKRFSGGPFLLEFPNLAELDVNGCERLIDPFKFNIQNIDASLAKIITSPSLKNWELRGTDFYVINTSGHAQVNGRYCSWVSPIAFFELFHELVTLYILGCRFEQLFSCEPGVDDDHDINTQSIAGITRLTLIGMPDMKHIWPEHSADDQFHGFSQNLELLEVKYCGSLMSLAPRSAWFPNLTSLVVWGCNELIRLVSSTNAKSLVNLTEMEVRYCDSLTEIVAIYDGEEGQNNSEDIVFRKLETLKLLSLSSLTSFTTSNCNFQFPSLELVYVGECFNMEIFCKGALSTPKLSEVLAEEENPFDSGGMSKERKMWKSDLNSTVRQLYKEMVVIDSSHLTHIWPEDSAADIRQNLESLEVRWCGSLMILAPKSACFPNLTSLVVRGCKELIKLVSSTTAKSLVNLTKMDLRECASLMEIVAIYDDHVGEESSNNTTVQRCKSIEEIVATKKEMIRDRLEEEEIIEFTQLRELILCDLHRFISFFCSPIISSSPERQEQDLTSSNQTSLFNKKVVLPKLDKLELKKINVHQIWDDQLPFEAGRITCWFHNLTIFKVVKCQNLRYLFTSSTVKSLAQLQKLKVKHCKSIEEIVATKRDEDDVNFSFPALERLEFGDLPKLKRFSGGPFLLEFPNLADIDVDGCERLIDPFKFNIQNIDALLAKICTSPSLKVCKLKGTKFELTYRRDGCFLKVDGGDCSLVSPIAFVELFQELETVHISNSRSEHLFPCESDVDDDRDINTPTTAHDDHVNLMRSEQCVADQSDRIPLNFKILQVNRCGSLMILAPKSAWFPNLTRLFLRGCNGLIRLVSSTTAKSLVNLKQMMVSECDSLIEIVAIYDGEEGTEDIVFPKLEILGFKLLRSLTSFTTNDCNFQLPSLEYVYVSECPNMEFFCKGALSTPKLSQVRVDAAGERKMWEGDLNSTVRRLHKEKMMQSDPDAAIGQFIKQTAQSSIAPESDLEPDFEELFGDLKPDLELLFHHMNSYVDEEIESDW